MNGKLALSLFAPLAAAAIICAQVPPSPRATTGHGNPATLVLTVDPARSHVAWSLGATAHTVHGTFAIKSGELRIGSADGAATGSIVVDAASGNSGNGSRDKKMHREVLESARFSEIQFRPERVTGSIAMSGKSTATLHGLLLLHGSEHEIAVPVSADLNGETWSGSARFEVPYVAWGLKNPSNFFLRVDKSVAVELQLAGNLKRE